MNRNQYVRHTLVGAIGFLLIAGMHLHFITVPAANADEAAYVNYNARHSFTLWNDLFDPVQRPLLNSVYTFSLVPVQMEIFGLPQKIWGVGLWQPRLLPMLLGFVSLLLLSIFLYRLASPLVSLCVTCCLAVSPVFFGATHIARPETAILVVFFINLIGLISPLNTRALFFVLGLAFGGCFFVHPNVIIPLVGFMACFCVWERASPLRVITHARYVWWLLGLGSGMAIYGCSINWDRALLDLYCAKGVTYNPFPIASYRWDVIGLLQNMSRLWRAGPAFESLVGLSIGLSAALLRKMSAISARERLIAGLAIALSLSFACLVASNNGYFYSLYVYPWNMLVVVYFLWKARHGALEFDSTDRFIVSFVTLFFMELEPGRYIDVFLFSIMLLVLATSLRGTTIFQGLLKCAAVVLVLTPGLVADGVMALSLIQHLKFHWAGDFLLIGALTLFIVYGRRRRLLGNSWTDRVVIAYACMILTLSLESHVQVIAGEIRESRKPSDLNQVIALLKEGKRVIGPAPVWIYAPSDAFRTDFPYVFLREGKILGPAFSPLPGIRKFNPDLLLLRDETLRQLEKDIRKTQAPVQLVDTSKVYRLFGADYKGFTLTAEKKK